MNMPSVTVSFTEVASTAVKRGERGVIAMILRNETVPETNPVVCASTQDIPKTLGDDAKKQIELAMMGYVNTPKKVIVYVLDASAEDYNEALSYFKTVKFDYIVAPSVSTDNQTASLVSYVKTERSNNKLIKAVLPNTPADTEGVVNYATEKVVENDAEYSTEEYCSRIAGIIAGTPLTMSCTYAPLTELTDCTRLTRAEMDAAQDAGKMIVWWDGEKVKTARGINSLKTLNTEKGEQFQKVKAIDTMDMISDDIRMTAEDSYIGKYPNTYDNKGLLISAIRGYLDKLVTAGVLSGHEVSIDIDANRQYLKDKGVNVEDMSDDDIKRAQTGSAVYLKATSSIVDAIEDIDLKITI